MFTEGKYQINAGLIDIFDKAIMCFDFQLVRPCWEKGREKLFHWGPESVLGGPVYVICGAAVVFQCIYFRYLIDIFELQQAISLGLNITSTISHC
jgi:hypothetical protein